MLEGETAQLRGQAGSAHQAASRLKQTMNLNIDQLEHIKQHGSVLALSEADSLILRSAHRADLAVLSDSTRF